jgi:ribokinase
VTAARLARLAGVIVVLNAAPARSMGDMDGLVDVVVVNAVEAEMLGSSPVHDLEGAAKAAGELRSLAPIVIVTAGSRGVAAAVPQSVTVQPYAVDEAETHGAGDVFAGALGARLALGSNIGDALRYANAAAALHVSTPAAEREALSPADVSGLLAAST